MAETYSKSYYYILKLYDYILNIIFLFLAEQIGTHGYGWRALPSEFRVSLHRGGPLSASESANGNVGLNNFLLPSNMGAVLENNVRLKDPQEEMTAGQDCYGRHSVTYKMNPFTYTDRMVSGCWRRWPWMCARLGYLQCISTGDTTVLHTAIDLHIVTRWQMCTVGNSNGLI